jgi:hypothetical protein
VQQAWVADRETCGDAACVANMTRDRSAVLRFDSRPRTDAWSDHAAGAYRHSDFISLWIAVRANTAFMSRSWAPHRRRPPSCAMFLALDDRRKMAGSGRRLRCEPKPVLTLKRTPSGFDVLDTSTNSAISGENCGMNGTVVWAYERPPH